MNPLAPPPKEDIVTERIARLLQDARRELAAYGIIDTPREEEYDRLVELAASLSGWPVAVLSFFDGRRQWFKASHGIELQEDDAASSFCLNIIAHGHARLLVADARNDERFRDNAYVQGPPHLVSYAGFPIRERSNQVTLGTLALSNWESGTLTERQMKDIALICEQIERLLELRREDRRRRLAEERLATANRQLEAFAYTIAHDLRAPLRHQSALTKLLQTEHKGKFDADATGILDRLQRGADDADALLRNLLEYARVADAAGGTREEFSVRPLLEEVIELGRFPQGFSIEVLSSVDRIVGPRVALRHILLNLLTNAVDHHDCPQQGQVQLQVYLHQSDYILEVTDDGPGIPVELMTSLYARRARRRENLNDTRGGLGSYIVTELVASLGGEIEILPPGEPLGSALNDLERIVRHPTHEVDHRDLKDRTADDARVSGQLDQQNTHATSVQTPSGKTGDGPSATSRRGTMIRVRWPAL